MTNTAKATRNTTNGQPNTQDDVQYMPTNVSNTASPTQGGGVDTTTTQYNSQQSGKLAPIATAPAPNWMSRALLLGKIVGIAFLAWAVVTAVITTWYWGVDQYNTYHYGPTRVYATTAVLDINGDSVDKPSDVAILNLRGQMVLLVSPAGDTSKVQTYNTGSLIGDGVSKTPAYVTFTPDASTKKLDIVVHIIGQTQASTFTNTGSGFTLVKQ